MTTKQVTDPHLRCVTDNYAQETMQFGLQFWGGSWSNAGRSNWDQQKWHQDLAASPSPSFPS